MSCSAWAWVTARVTSVPPPEDAELPPESADAVEVLAAAAEDAVPTDSTPTRVRTTRVLMLPVTSPCDPEQPGCALSEELPTVSKTATCEPGCTAPATTSGRQKA